VFEKWEVDFVGPNNPPVRISRERYIITTTRYLTRWDEEALVKYYSEVTTMHLLFEELVTRFEFPRVLMIDWGTHFINNIMQEMTE
jgi:hypothetical protein